MKVGVLRRGEWKRRRSQAQCPMQGERRESKEGDEDGIAYKKPCCPPNPHMLSATTEHDEDEEDEEEDDDDDERPSSCLDTSSPRK